MKSNLAAVRKMPVSESVYRQLHEKIVRRELAPGAPLPAERQMSQMLGVNRGAVREAIKRLQQAGLVSVSQGGNTTVLDYLDDAGLELLPALLVTGEETLDHAVVRSVMAMRSALAPEVAASAAERGGAALADALEAHLKEMRADPHNLKGLQRGALAFWRKLVEGSGNVAFRLAFNSMSKSYTQALDLLVPVLAAEYRDFENLARIAQAVRTADAEAARGAARAHVDIGRKAVDAALSRLEGGKS